jgi:putative transposase
MTFSKPHRKRVKHFDLPGHYHELTFSCYRRLPLLTNDSWREQLARAIDSAGDRHSWQLAAVVFMPEHVHLLVHPGESASKIAEFLFAIKRPYSYRIKQLLTANRSPLLKRLTISQRPGVSTFRDWQEGPGYDRNLTTQRAMLAAINYLHANPVRRGSCLRAIDWRWSSARWSSARWYESEGREIDAPLPRLTPLPAGFFHDGTQGDLT